MCEISLMMNIGELEVIWVWILIRSFIWRIIKFISIFLGLLRWYVDLCYIKKCLLLMILFL